MGQELVCLDRLLSHELSSSAYPDSDPDMHEACRWCMEHGVVA